MSHLKLLFGASHGFIDENLFNNLYIFYSGYIFYTNLLILLEEIIVSSVGCIQFFIPESINSK